MGSGGSLGGSGTRVMREQRSFENVVKESINIKVFDLESGSAMKNIENIEQAGIHCAEPMDDEIGLGASRVDRARSARSGEKMGPAERALRTPQHRRKFKALLGLEVSKSHPRRSGRLRNKQPLPSWLSCGRLVDEHGSSVEGMKRRKMVAISPDGEVIRRVSDDVVSLARIRLVHHYEGASNGGLEVRVNFEVGCVIALCRGTCLANFSAKLAWLLTHSNSTAFALSVVVYRSSSLVGISSRNMFGPCESSMAGMVRLTSWCVGGSVFRWSKVGLLKHGTGAGVCNGNIRTHVVELSHDPARPFVL
ncbi:hypothetical protein ACSQ67_003037 [Phaseolus vulgaris]